MTAKAKKDTRKKLTIAEKVALTERARTIPFTLTDEEVEALLRRIAAAEERGDADEAETLMAQIPVSWQAAATVIEQFGTDRLRELDLNLSYAVKVLGEGFVYGDR